MPQWLLSTSMLSDFPEVLSTQPCQAQIPSVRLKIAVVGTGGGTDNEPPKRSSSSSARRPLASSYTRQALVERGDPAKGLPSVITLRTRSGIILASCRA